MIAWRYEEVEIREDVEGQLPENVQLHVYKVTSGDSGEKYYVQRLKVWRYPLTEETRKPQIVYLCNCGSALGALPLSILGIKPLPCKHAENLKKYLEEKSGKEKEK